MILPFNFNKEQDYKIFEDEFGSTVFKFLDSSIELVVGDLIHLSVLKKAKIHLIDSVKDDELLHYSLLKHYERIPDKNFYSVIYLFDINKIPVIKLVGDEIIISESERKSIFSDLKISD